MRGTDDEGAASALAFVVAGVLFIAAVAAVLAYTSDKVPPRQANPGTNGYHAEAQSLLRVLISSNGTDGSGLVQRPALVELPGLLDASQLSWFKASADNYTQGVHDASPFNYTTVRESLGLDEVHLGFYLQVNMTFRGSGSALDPSNDVSYPTKTSPNFGEGDSVDPAVTTLAIEGAPGDRYLVQLWVFPQT